jgi:2-dehydro-3-deoxygluconokinase
MAAVRNFTSIGECMLEFSRLSDGNWRLGYAGDTLNTAWYFRALAGDEWNIDYVTRLGSDSHSAAMLNFLARYDIGTRYIQRDTERQPGLYLIETKNGERSFTYWRSQSAARHMADDEGPLAAAMDASDVIYFSGITLAILAPDRRGFLLNLVADARASGKTTVFDPNIRPRLWESVDAIRDWLTRAAAVSSLSLPSFDDEREWFSDADIDACASRFLDAGAERVCVKNGGGPICYGDSDGLKTVSSLDKVHPVDSTGAGDSFNGALLRYYLSGTAFEDAVRRAHRVSSLVVLHPGALLDPDKIRSIAEREA